MGTLLIYPEFSDTFWSCSYALRFGGENSAFPPLGLITVAALLPKQFQIQLVDLNVDGPDDDLAWADMADISAMAIQRKSAVRVNEQWKGKGFKNLAGGLLFTAETTTNGWLPIRKVGLLPWRPGRGPAPL